MANIIFIAPRIPFPPNKGDKIRSFHILQKLKENHKIYLAFIVDDENDLNNIEGARGLSDEIVFDVVKFPKIRKISSCMRAIFTHRSITGSFFYSEKLQSKIDEWILSNGITDIFCLSSSSAEYIFRSKHYQMIVEKINLIMDFIDVDSRKWRQYSQSATGIMQQIYKFEEKQILALEKKIARKFNHLFFVSEAEKSIFLENGVAAHVIAMSNGVNLEMFVPPQIPPKPTKIKKIVFVGAMDYLPNIEGINWFVGAVLPYIYKQYEDVMLYIVGSNPSRKVKNLAVKDKIIVTGFVDDVREYIASADVCVVPLMVARGIQNKVMEAMAMGKAVVCTPQALEGIDAEPGKDVLIAAAEVEFADTIVKLLEDTNLAQEIGNNARTSMEQKYSWEGNLAKLASVVGTRR